MNDISKPGGGIKPRQSAGSEKKEVSPSREREETRRAPEEAMRERRKSEASSSEQQQEGAREGSIYGSVRPLEERNQKRQENAFLKKLKDKRAGVQERMSHGGDFRNKGWGKWKYVFGGVVLVLLIAYVFFPSTSVEITPRVENTSLNNSEFTALASTTAPLSYETVRVSQEASGEAQATAAQQTEDKASGELTIYNTYTAESQRLIRNTRFRSPDGFIYRVNDSVTVPGMQGNTPGQVTVTVYADQPGGDYNFTETGTRFAIPGFENSPELFEGFYAETQTALDGGYSGISKVVSEEELERVTSEVSETLRTQLLEQARADMAEGFILFDGAGEVTYDTVVEDRENLESDSAQVTVTGTFEGVIFQRSQLASAIASRQVSEYQGEAVEVTNWEDVTFQNASTTGEAEDEAVGESDGSEVSFALSGPIALYWEVPVQDIVRTLAGTDKSAFDQNMNQYRFQISRAETSMRPFWKNTFPTVPADITVDVLEAS